MAYALLALGLLLSVSGIFNWKQHGEIKSQHDTIVLNDQAVKDCGQSVAALRASVDDQAKQIAGLTQAAELKNVTQDKNAQQVLHAVPHAPPVKTVDEFNGVIQGWSTDLGGGS